MDKEKIKRLLWGGPPRAVEHKEMSRGQQTAWIIGVILVVALFAYNYMEKSRDPCGGIFQDNEIKCRSDAALERLESR